MPHRPSRRPLARRRSRVTRIALALLLVSAATAWSPARGATSPSLPRSTPEAQGVSSSAILDFVRAADRDIDAMHSVMIVRHGHVIAEGWWAPYAADRRHTLFSLTKSFTSTAAGFAIAEGRLSVDDPVLKFFPDVAPANPDDNLKRLRVRDLLSMSTGHHTEPRFADTTEWTKAFVTTPLAHKPGTFFLYNTPSTYMVGAIVQELTGQSLDEYLRPRLFEPLGIDDRVWEKSPEGLNIGGYGLHLRTESLARFGQLYLQKGMWQGRQLLPASWVAAATSRQVSNGSDPASDWDQGYGFQFWRTRHNTYRGDGAFGQYCLVLPDQDAVVVITSGVRNMQAVLDLVFDELLPAFGPKRLPAAADTHRTLTTTLAGLQLHVPTGAATPGATVTPGRRYVFPANFEGLEWLSLDRDADGGMTLVMSVGGSERRVSMGHGTWKTGRLALGSGTGPVGTVAASSEVAGAGAWTSPTTYAATLAFYETPFKWTMTLTFTGDRVEFAREQHVGFGDGKLPTLVGTATAAR